VDSNEWTHSKGSHVRDNPDQLVILAKSETRGVVGNGIQVRITTLPGTRHSPSPASVYCSYFIHLNA
jgi:hypothetical protein